jgi:hypothetical protein
MTFLRALARALLDVFGLLVRRIADHFRGT